MAGRTELKSARSINEIEADLRKAEAAYADADARVKAASQQRRAALSTINSCQSEFDEAVAALRRKSVPGSKWRGLARVEADDNLLELRPEDIAEDASELVRPVLTSVA